MSPLETFYNLPEEKQNRILKAAIDEFSQNGYKDGSIQSIADKAGVSKGSMYQYFKNKQELFLYIFDITIEMKIDYLNEIDLEEEDLAFFDLIERICLDTVELARENPELHRFYNKMMQGVPLEIKDIVDEKLKSQGIRKYRTYINRAIEKGEVIAGIDIDFLSFVVYKLLGEFGMRLGQKITDISKEEARDEVRQFVNFLKSGFQYREEDF